MNYIITEEQNQRLLDSMIDYFDSNLIPHEGWSSLKQYKKELEDNGGEIFMFLEPGEGFGESQKHMWYSVYENEHVKLKEEDCPLVVIPDEIYGALTGYFGDLWKPIFIEWFKQNTKLPLKNVDSYGWTNPLNR